MDLRTIMNKLKQRLYDTPDQVIADARLIFENCRIYNEEESEIYRVCGYFSSFFVIHDVLIFFWFKMKYLLLIVQL